MIAKVIFRVRCHTELNESVAICGNTQQFGYWNPNLAAKLQTNTENYPNWHSEDNFEVEINAVLEFKLVIFDGVKFRWENIANRCLKFKSHKQLVILTFNLPNIAVTPLQRLLSDSDLQQLQLSTPDQVRRIPLKHGFLPLDDDSSNPDQDSDWQSLFKDDSLSDSSIDVDFSNFTSFQGLAAINEINDYPQPLTQV